MCVFCGLVFVYEWWVWLCGFVCPSTQWRLISSFFAKLLKTFSLINFTSCAICAFVVFDNQAKQMNKQRISSGFVCRENWTVKLKIHIYASKIQQYDQPVGHNIQHAQNNFCIDPWPQVIFSDATKTHNNHTNHISDNDYDSVIWVRITTCAACPIVWQNDVSFRVSKIGSF